ncbi:MAG: Asp-tRNA(Asn)/Glu-tRNA(Gln) amidotransferase subunit GatC [Desulfobacteraceae bacterium]|nr:Asp-tRNA(Asn)/Glu-tRNA(Gln) amidotransferase subunit GatC [Desulfobacteraceae bacterium]
MKITAEEVEYVAGLARLELTPDEVAAMTGQLDRILTYAAKLNELDTTGIEPVTHALAIRNAFRPDAVQDSLPREEALANAPEQNGEAFVVPRVL